MTKNIFYRADIDGLRALAVISVIIYHIDSSLLPGGYLGVDIFFVISGFLITGLLLNELQKTKKINFKTFYSRRVKRLLPALLTVIISTLVVGFLLFAPADYFSLLKSAVASLISVANIFFYVNLDQGYFAKDSSEIPLLHMWSLAVEEQFYLIWPVLMAFIYKQKGTSYLFYFLVISIFLSFGLAQTLLSFDQSFAYYSLPTRVWELSAGGALAIYLKDRKAFSNNISTAYSIIGAILIGASFYWVTSHSDVPGKDNIPLIIGTLMLITAGKVKGNISQKLLSNKLWVFIGLISYSAYLWHWPIIAFTKYAAIEIDLIVGTTIFISTFLLATITYYIVETPLRNVKVTPSKAFTRYYIVPVALVGLSTVVLAYGIKSFSPSMYNWSAYSEVTDITPNWKYKYNCQYSNFGAESKDESECIFPKGSPYKTLLIGDSNGAHYIGMLQEFAQYDHWSFKNITQSACPPLIETKELDWIEKKYAKACLEYRKYLSSNLMALDHIIIGGDWLDYDRFAEFRPLFIETINKLAKENEKVTILAKIPTFSHYNTECEKRRIKITSLNCSLSRYDKLYEKKSSHYAVNNFLLELSNKYKNVNFFDTKNSLCPNNICSPVLNGKFIYSDGSHLSMDGSHMLGAKVLKSQEKSALGFN
ncbi:acyltransferase family protein [Colwellia sp. 4_MG-2023]|uniref:acyltransferase family protein n=1 Tax=unclassified Colwellia TaxID=196834 RepID=UPI0026E20407|nr:MULTISPECIES: acyltransferase family protein [unclassified Colwellia]MDO6506830.1 acyltransferase family protein [Colwellia sp. 5_MG-2023]MDO6555795.1 acyltransferase family protein [Colwellia sp. 4_MG-2023]